MYWLKLLVIKVLKKLKILSFINFSVWKVYNRKNICIPFINGMGLENFILKKDWLDTLIRLYVDEKRGAFIDVGANIGQTLIRVKTSLPNINYLGFEPNIACVFYMNSIIALNNFNNCQIQNYALHNKLENLIFEKSSNTDSRASVVESLRPGFFSNKEYVLGLDYQTLFMDFRVSLIKIDVEGAELNVLRGMENIIRKYKPVILCEVLDSHSDEVFNFTQTRATEVSEFITYLDYFIVNFEKRSDVIVSYKILDTILLKQWTKESKNYNDYIFMPKQNEKQLLELLNKAVISVK